MTTTTGRPTSAGTDASATSTGPVGRITSTSLTAGAVGAAVLVLGVFPGASEAHLVGASLVAFAAAWALLAYATTRWTTSPQRWAYVPAVIMAVGGSVLVAVNPAEPAMTHLAWVWAPVLVVLAVWGERRARRSMPGRARILLYPVILAMLLAGVGGLYQVTTSAPQDEAGRVPGRLVDVGGYRLHLDCAGTGSPTVVLLNGLGETSPQWARIRPVIATSTRVCAYDRAGQGWSEDSPNPADATNAATDLHALLTAAGEPGPYVLAGHSSGGIHALAFTDRYPSDVAGMVLIDSASPRQLELVTSFAGEYQFLRRALAPAPTVFRFGLGHLTQSMSTPVLPGDAGRRAAVFANSPRGVANLRAEQAALPESFRQARSLTTLGSTPLVVLTARDNVDHKPGWGAAQDQLAALSTTTRHTVADFDHVGLLHDPEGAAVSVEAISDVVAAVRNPTTVSRRG